MRTFSELKSAAKSNIDFKYIGIFIFFMIVSSVFNVVFLTIPLTVGMTSVSLKAARKEEYSLTTIFEGFKLQSFIYSVIMFLITFVYLFTTLSATFSIARIALSTGAFELLSLMPVVTILLAVAFVVGTMYLSLTTHILADEEDITAMDAMKLSVDILKGNMLRFWGLSLSFILWIILGVFTFGLLYIWLLPYIQLTSAEFYLDLKNNLNENEGLDFSQL